MKSRLFLFLKGVAMGAADVVPGVSGGTIAFISGIYEELLLSIRSITPANIALLWKAGFNSFWRAINGNFLAVLLSGILLSIFSLAKLFGYLLANHPVPLWSFFFGLIVASLIVVGRKVSNWGLTPVVALQAGMIIGYTIISSVPAETTESLWFVFLSGAIAICAMILPGISGSFILLLLGKYEFMLQSISEMRIAVIAVFGVGCVVGLLSFARLLSWMFKKYHDMTVALMVGFMLGSLKKVWPWKEVLEWHTNSKGIEVPLLEEPILPQSYVGDPQIVFAIVAALFGFLLVYILETKFSSRTKPL
jgi:putative membrane protein